MRLRPNPSLVISFIPISLWQLNVLLAVGCMNCKMLFYKNSKNFRTPYTFVKIISLYYSGWEERVLKKSMFDMEPRNVVDIISYSICCPIGEGFIKQILRGLVFVYLKEITKLSSRCCKYSKLNSCQSFSLEEPLIARVIARAALYCIDSSLWWKELL